MGFFSWLFSDTSDGSTIKVRESEDKSKIVADKYTHTGGDKHVHESYSIDKSEGTFKEYHGGENSSDRSYNK